MLFSALASREKVMWDSRVSFPSPSLFYPLSFNATYNSCRLPDIVSAIFSLSDIIITTTCNQPRKRLLVCLWSRCCFSGMFLRIVADDVEEYSITLPLWRSVTIKWQVVWHSIHFSISCETRSHSSLIKSLGMKSCEEGEQEKEKHKPLCERIKGQFLVSFCFFPVYDNELYWNVLQNEGEFIHGTRKCCLEKRDCIEVCVLFSCSPSSSLTKILSSQ